MRISHATLPVLLTLCVAAAHGQDALTLRYHAQSKGLKYKTLETSVFVVMNADAEPRTTTTIRGATELHRVKSSGDKLELAVDTLSVTFTRDGVPGTPPKHSPVRAKLTARGFTPKPGGQEILSSPLTLVLPEPTLKLGTPILGVQGLGESSFAATSEPSPPIPVRVPVTTKVAGLVTVGGVRCVKLEQSARVSERLDGGKRLYEYVMRRTAYFDPAAGCIVESQTEERVDDAVLPPPKSGLLRKRRETVRKLTLER